MKYVRQAKISELISMYEIETQQELAEKLKESGVVVTQATISRDIKDMRLIKILTDSGVYKYANITDDFSQVTSRFLNIMKETIIKIKTARNIVLVSTLPGTAEATGTAIDAMNHCKVAGTLSGDNTVMIVVEDDEFVPDVVQKIEEAIGK